MNGLRPDYPPRVCPLPGNGPDRVGRVRAMIPGVAEPQTPWADPIGLPGAGDDQRGMYIAPPIGAPIVVGFFAGDAENPFYLAGAWWSREGSPTRAVPSSDPDAPGFEIDIEELDQVMRFVFGRWEIVIDNRVDTIGYSYLRIRDHIAAAFPSTGNHDGANDPGLPNAPVRDTEIRLDSSGSVIIRAPGDLTLKAGGMLSLDAPIIQINERLAKATTRPW